MHIEMNHFVPIFTAFIAAFVCIIAARKRRRDI
jgi:hypothetical protein